MKLYFVRCLMNTAERNIIENSVKYCLLNFKIRGNSRIIASFLHQLLKRQGIEAPAAEGLVYVEIKGLMRPFAHCFNIMSCDIIDGSIYGFALINKTISDLFPLYIVGTPPGHIDYYVNKEIKPETQYIFKNGFLDSVISLLHEYEELKPERFDDLYDSKKQDIFYKL